MVPTTELVDFLYRMHLWFLVRLLYSSSQRFISNSPLFCLGTGLYVAQVLRNVVVHSIKSHKQLTTNYTDLSLNTLVHFHRKHPISSMNNNSVFDSA
jgi:hypothetical protein